MALTIAQKSSIRRHLLYPTVGLLTVSPGGGTLASASAGWRYFQAYGFLEYKMNNLNPDEEARLTGLAFGSIALVGPQPNPGDTLSLTFASPPGSQACAAATPLPFPQTISVVAPAPVNGVDARLTLCNAIAAAVGKNSALQAAGFYSTTPFGTGPYAQNAIPLPEVAFICPQPFTISSSGSGVLVPQITAQGNFLPPTATLDGKTQLWGYLPVLDGLETAFAGSSQNLDTMKADVWTARGNEIGQRQSLYAMWQQSLSDFLGVPLNPNRRNNRASVGALRYA